MSKILIFSDLHIHAHKKSQKRLEDCLKCLRWVFDTAIERKIKNVVFAGDLFHERQKIDVITYQKVFEIFHEYFVDQEPKFNLWLLLGNHDLWHRDKWDISSVKPLKAIPNVHVISEPTTLEIDEHSISFLPFTHNPAEDLKAIEKGNSTVLVGHVAIDGALWNIVHGTRAEVSIEHDGDMQKVDSSIFKNWQQVFLGHYHAEQKLDYNVEYIGSPLQLSFGEAFQHKHIIEYDLEDNSKEYIRNTFSPQHFIIPEKDIDKYDFNNNFIRIVVEDMGKSDVIKMRSELMQNNNIESLEFKQVEKKVEDDENLLENAKSILAKESEMLQKYVEIAEHKLDSKKLIELGKSICEWQEN